MHKIYEKLVLTFPEREQWTLPHVLRHRAKTHGGQVFLNALDEGVTYTYGEVADMAERVARGLLARGGRPGDRCVIMAANSSRFLFTWFGLALAGMVEVPINTAYVHSFLEHQVRTVQPRVAVIDTDHVQRFIDIRETGACDSIEHFYLIGSAADIAAAEARLAEAGWSGSPFDVLLDGGEAPLPTVSVRDNAAIFFTSGTTGLSKGAMMTHSHLYFFAQQCVSLTRLTEDDVYYSVLPFFHVNAQGLATYPVLIAGARLVLGRRFSASGWLGTVREHQVTVTNIVGVMSDFIWSQPPTPDDADNRLRCAFGVPTPTRVEEFTKRFGIESWVEAYGMTEAALPVLTPYGEPRPAGSSGLGVEEYFDIRIVDPLTDEELPVGETGELVVRPKIPGITTTGYYNMPDKTIAAFRNLWYHTGDAVRRDAEGYYYFVDRIKDALRRRGENISSYEVEQAIIGMPGIAECAVIGVPADFDAGEDEVMAVVVLEPGVTADPEEIWRWCERRLPAFTVPRYIRFAAELPKTPTMKIRKVVLREEGTAAAQVFDREARGR